MTIKLDLTRPFQVLDHHGGLTRPLPPGITAPQTRQWYRMMWVSRYFSNKLVALQRQGRATTWIPCHGQEGTAVGMATPLLTQDWVTGSPREIGAYFLKGVPPAAVAYYHRGYAPPPELWRPEARCLPMTIVIGTQTHHSVGLALAAKIKGENAVVVGSCGDGASSEGDFSEALNFAGVFQAPVVFVVVNNGWAISVPRSKQTVTAAIALRGQGFGLPARLVDGNDLLAMYVVMQEAVDRARSGGGPTLVEALTYRMAAHSTADDPGRYRPAGELQEWEARDPLQRFRQFLFDQGWLDEAGDRELQGEAEGYVAAEVERAFAYPVPGPEALFNNVYAELTPRLRRQRDRLND